MNDLLIPQSKLAADFLAWMNPSTSTHLEFMESRGRAYPKATKFNSADTDKIRHFVEENNGPEDCRNLYFVPNAEFLHGKRNKANIGAVRFLHVDLDFKDYPGTLDTQRTRILDLLFDREKCPDWIPKPTAVWMTGGGYQAVWRLREPMDPENAEKLNIALLRGLEGGPGTHDVSRLLRLPGTINWLNDKKRKDGREPVLGEVAYPTNFVSPPISYGTSDISPPLVEASDGPVVRGSAPSKKPRAVELIPLPKDTDQALPPDPQWRDAIKNGTTPSGKSYVSRSELMFAATIWMLSEGVEPGTALSVLLSPDFAIGEHIRDRNSGYHEALKYAERQVQRAQMVVESRGSDWPSTTKSGFLIRDDPNNIRHALAKFGVVICRNDFTQEDEFEGGGLEDRDFNDIADILCSAFQRKLSFSASSAAIKRELTAVAHENRYHPVLDYLGRVQWGGISRLDLWLSKYCGVEDTELHREFASKTLIAAVRRIKMPGTKFDTMLVLEGAQGVGKSRLLRMLAVCDAWFCESLNLRSDDRERAQILGRAWIVECQELDGLNKMASENLKKFLSESTDTYRKPYDKNARHYPRHSIIVGTTNEIDYLRDLTGNRRFWPVRVGMIDLAGLSSVVDQLWAEAVQREAGGEEITLSPALWAEAASSQALRVAEDPFADVIAGALGDGPGKVSMDGIKVLLGIPTAKLTAHDSRRIKSAMEQQGWRYGTFRLWVTSRSERRPVRGFLREGSDGTSPEIGVRTVRNGEVEVGQIGANGKFISASPSLDQSDESPF